MTIAPGTRIELRNEEWLVRRVDLTVSGGQQISCIGLSELVKDKEAIFFTEIDRDAKFGKGIKILNPEDTKFVQDMSDGFIDTRLYLEALLRESPPTDAKLYVGPLYMTKKTEHVEIVHNINFTKRLKDESNQRAFSDIK
jgi:hypothetical protein